MHQTATDACLAGNVMMAEAISLSRLLYVALAAIMAVTAWFIFRTGDPAAADRDSSGNPIVPRQRTRRDELIETRDRVTRQIEILKSPMRSRDYTRLSQEAVEKLQAILDAIEEELGDSNPAR
jgi:hypothetical protein